MLSLQQAREILKQLDGKKADDLESEVLEFKSWNANPAAKDSEMRAIREVVVAFANQRGGTIIVGVADAKRSRREAIQGVGSLDTNEVRRRIYDGTEPHILVDVEELIEPEGRLLLIRVPQGMPPHTTSEGTAKIRVGKECKPFTGPEIARKVFSGGQRDITAEILPGATHDDLDPDQIALMRRMIQAEAENKNLARLETRELLSNLGLVRNGEVTYAAVLLLGKAASIARWTPQHELIYVRFKTATSYDSRRDMKGPLLAVLEALRELLDSNMIVWLLQTRGFGELAFPDLMWQVAREATLNALVHRDYFVRQSVHVHLYKNHIEVSSPGGFIGGVTASNVLRHTPIRRNPLLADVMLAIGLVNRVGQGVDRIFENLLRMGKRLPYYEADESSVKLVLPLATHEPFAKFVAEEAKENRHLELDNLIVLRGVMERGYLDRWAASEWLQLPEEQAADRLESMRDRKYLVPQGRGRGTAYRLSPHLSKQLRGPGAADQDFPLDDVAVRVRIETLLKDRGRLTNAEIRRFSGYSRLVVHKIMREMIAGGMARLEGKGRAAHYLAGPALKKGKSR